MELKQKGEQANVSGFAQLLVTMKWTNAADFDLAAVYEKKDGTPPGLVYFGDKGNLNQFPFMQLSGDAGVGDKGGANEETMRITKLDGLSKVHIICWDYGKIKTGSAARFKDSDVSLYVVDDKGTTYNVNLDTGDMGNTTIIATIDNNNPIGAVLINTSKAGTLKELKQIDSLMAIING